MDTAVTIIGLVITILIAIPLYFVIRGNNTEKKKIKAIQALYNPENTFDFEETEKWNVLIWSDSKHRDPAHKWMRGLFKEWAIEDAERMKKLKEKDLGVPKYK